MFSKVIINKHSISTYLVLILLKTLTLFRMGIFEAVHGSGDGCKKAPLSKICHTYPTMIKLGTVIPYLKKIQKMYESRDTHPEFC